MGDHYGPGVASARQSHARLEVVALTRAKSRQAVQGATMQPISLLTVFAGPKVLGPGCCYCQHPNVYYTGNQQIHVGVLSPTIDDDDNRCLVDVNSRPRLIECSYAKAKRMKLYWQFTQILGVAVRVIDILMDHHKWVIICRCKETLADDSSIKGDDFNMLDKLDRKPKTG
uniref:Uncharacterized protein n=1 Tax=Sphaerodactylus townsendi TaxID=933632 RepID=A0ACB8G394_9SAUR